MESARKPQIEKDESIYLTRSNSPGSAEKIADAVARSAYSYNRAYEGCSRCVLVAVNDHFAMVSDARAFGECVKASTGLSAGVARMGETCGALTGAIMAVGLEFSSPQLASFDCYAQTMSIARELFQKFEATYGTVNCTQIQTKLLGRKYDFSLEQDRDAWYADGGLDVCPRVCATAARLAAEIILDRRRRREEPVI